MYIDAEAEGQGIMIKQTESRKGHRSRGGRPGDKPISSLKLMYIEAEAEDRGIRRIKIIESNIATDTEAMRPKAFTIFSLIY